MKQTVKKHLADKNNWTAAAIIGLLLYGVSLIRELQTRICDYDAKCQEYVTQCENELYKLKLKECLRSGGDCDEL